MTRLGLIRSKHKGRAAVATVALALGLGCAAPQPVLYPNPHLEQVGVAQSKRDIAACESLAAEYVKNPGAVEQAAKRGAAGAATGAVLGAIGGAIGDGAGRGAAIGSAVGGVGGVLSALAKSDQPSPTEVNFVNHCLQERGYRVVGWQ